MRDISAITPYPMPTPGELPANVVYWAANRNRVVLLIHDMQRYFVKPFPAGRPPVVELIHNTAALRERCARLGIPVAYTAQPGRMTRHQRGLLMDFWGPGMRADPADRQIIAQLAPADGDWQFTKWRYSAFFRSLLLERMRDHGRDQLIICGVYAHVGILMTAADAYTNDIQPFLVADAVADVSADHHRQAISYAAQCCAAVTTTGQVLSQLGSPTAGLVGGAARRFA